MKVKTLRHRISISSTSKYATNDYVHLSPIQMNKLSPLKVNKRDSYDFVPRSYKIIPKESFSRPSQSIPRSSKANKCSKKFVIRVQSPVRNLKEKQSSSTDSKLRYNFQEFFSENKPYNKYKIKVPSNYKKLYLKHRKEITLRKYSSKSKIWLKDPSEDETDFAYKESGKSLYLDYLASNRRRRADLFEKLCSLYADNTEKSI